MICDQCAKKEAREIRFGIEEYPLMGIVTTANICEDCAKEVILSHNGIMLQATLDFQKWLKEWARKAKTLHSDDTLITVCAECLQASCWQGEFMCDKSRTADVVKKTVKELRELGRENESYWKTDEELMNG